MRLSWITLVHGKPDDQCPYKRRLRKMPCEARGREWSREPTSQGSPGTTRSMKTRVRIVPQSLQRECGPATYLISDSGLQNRKRVSFCCLSHPASGNLFQWPRR